MSPSLPSLRRSLNVTPRILNEDAGTVEFVASDSSIDSYAEIVRHDGWRFTRFAKNAPFVDSHDYSSIEKLLGQVIDWRIEKTQLVETVRYARQPGTLADWAFKMVRDGFLKAVSVGFVPLRMVDKYSAQSHELNAALSDLKLAPEEAARVRAVYLEQEQIELSQCVIGANPNALARAYKAGSLSEHELDQLCALRAASTNAPTAHVSAAAVAATRRTKLALLAQIQAQL
jgi:hypothetical protein